MKCPTKDCKNEAIIHGVYGVVKCKTCQLGKGLVRTYDNHPITKLHRIQEQRDNFQKELLQPFDGHKVNPKFFEAYPEKIKDYGVADELKKF